MPVKPNFRMNDIKKEMKEDLEAFEKTILENFERAALEAVNNAKVTNTYKDKSKNLRGSIGYVMFHDGEEIGNYFGDNNKTPEAVSESLIEARSKVDIYKRPGLVVILVAGMNYASFVEEYRGLDVLASSAHLLQSTLTAKLEEIKNDIT